MTENKQYEIVSLKDQMTQLKKRLEKLENNHLHLQKSLEQLGKDLYHEAKQQHVQVPSPLDKAKEVSVYVKENRSFIQSIWKRKHK